MQKSLRVGGIGSEAVGRTSGLTQKKKNLMVKKSDKIVKDQRSYESRKQVAHK